MCTVMEGRLGAQAVWEPPPDKEGVSVVAHNGAVA